MDTSTELTPQFQREVSLPSLLSTEADFKTTALKVSNNKIVD